MSWILDRRLYLLLLFFWGGPLAADDTEGCLVCHRYRGLGRLDDAGRSIRLYYVDSDYYRFFLGPHARLRCTDCHNRNEVNVIPHKTVTPVDCTRACHLVSPTDVEKRFGHDRIETMLQHSVHNEQVLDRCNRLLNYPLAPEQSRCLLCHDEPTYRLGNTSWAEQEAPIARCRVCHDERIPVNTRHYYWHVYARSLPGHSHQELIRNCAVCHANEKILADFDLPNSITSYLASFHGKASLLGDDTAAECLDCHAVPRDMVHNLASHEDSAAPTNPEHIADTCRSPYCHPLAGRKVGSAAIHLDLSTSRGIEFFIAALFILLIIMTFGPSVLLNVLDMFHGVLGRHDPDVERNYERAVKLLADPRSRSVLVRFTPFQRVQHWILVVSFTLLVVTGFPMKFADQAWAAWLIEKFHGLTVARIVHRTAGIVLIVGFLFHLLVYVGHHFLTMKRREKWGFFRTFVNLPMVITPSDFKKMGQYILYLTFLRKHRPRWGRFSLEEKFEYFGVLWGTVILGITGLLMWDDALTTRYLPGRVLTVANLIHGFEAYLALLHVGIVHLAGVLLKPAVFPCSPAMFTGNTPPEELAEIHPLLLDEAEAALNAENGPLAANRK